MVTIQFSNPGYLWFLFALPLIVIIHFYMLRHAKRRALKFANFVALKRVTGERMITKNYTMLFLRLTIVLCIVLAMAGTAMWYESNTTANTYVLTIDTSASMSAQDITPTRLGAAKEYARRFVDELDANTPVGVVAYSGVTLIEQVPTTDHAVVNEAIEALDITASGTDIPGAIITSTNLLVDEDRGRVIILISDGSNTIEDFSSKSIRRAMSYALSKQVKIYTMGVGKSAAAPIGYLPTYYNVSATYNADNLKSIANLTGGEYYYAADAASLASAYSAIKDSQHQSAVALSLTNYLVILALVLLIIDWILANTRFRPFP